MSRSRKSASSPQREYMAGKPQTESVDVLIVGAGHNGLVSAILLARSGLKVLVCEDKDTIGGCVKTEHPFKTVPAMAASSGAYLLGLMPPELLRKLDVDIPRMRRDPHYFVPTMQEGKYILFGSNREEMKEQFLQNFSQKDWEANLRLEEELEAFRQDVGHTWLQEPLSIEETAEKFVRPSLRKVFVDLCRKPVRDYLERFGFESDLLKAMYATTDGFSGLTAGYETPGTGMNFLIHNMCRLPGADGTWMVVKGGMGTVTRLFAEAAQAAGARIDCSRGVQQLLYKKSGGQLKVTGALLKDGTTVFANTVVVNADPFRMRDIIGRNNLPAKYNARLDNYKRDGSTMKVNLCLKALPTFTCLPENKGQFGTTTHILPQEDPIGAIRRAFAEVQAGKLPEFPTIEWYTHTTVDPTIQDGLKHHNAALFVEWVPYTIAGSSWEVEEEKYVRHLFSIIERFAPGFSSLVEEFNSMSPPALEKHFGITRGHIHHVDNTFGFSDRLPYNTPIAGLYSCSAGCHPAGSVIGASGHNSAMRVLRDRPLAITSMSGHSCSDKCQKKCAKEQRSKL